MKIKGWEKLSGITFKDYCIINPIHNAQETMYYADVMNLITKNRLRLELEMTEVFKPADKYGRMREYFTVKLEDNKKNIKIQRIVELMHIRNVSSFRQIVEFCIEDYLNETGENEYGLNGIIDHIQQSGTTVNYTKSIPTFDDFLKKWRTPKNV